jgi:hypothetical protein
LLVKETLGREACGGWLLKLHSIPLWLVTEYEDNEKVNNFSSILHGALEGASFFVVGITSPVHHPISCGSSVAESPRFHLSNLYPLKKNLKIK